MKKYIIRRFLMFIPLLVGITIISFTVMHLTPGSPVDEFVMNPNVDARARERFYKIYGLDQPLYKQYAGWVVNVVTFDFGRSFRDGRKVMDKIGDRLPATLLLNILSLTLIFAVAVPIGVISAVKHNSFTDRIFTLMVFAGYSLPAFALALMLMYFFGVKLGWLPVSGMVSVNFSYLTLWGKVADLIKHLILPVVTSAVGGLAFMSRYMRSTVLEVMRQDFIKAVRARGVRKKRVITVHVFRNALIPLVTLFGLLIPSLIGGSVVFETIFSWPGMGRLAYGAIMSRDYPVVMGVGIIMALLTLAGNLIADIGYAAVDPRIRYRE
ncbi:MAG: ABC transporter permease [Elusimicrobiota bacterium]|nr:ABC transporter permease [Elusimicrobiota bacterium]